MRLGTIGQALIALGVILLLYALNMPVSIRGSDVVNLHLISERQNMLLLGAMLFIGGIILFAVAKLKQTGEENALENSHRLEKKEKVKQLIGHATEHGTTFALTTLPQFWRRAFVGLSQGWRSIAIRLCFGFIIAAIVNEVVYDLSLRLDRGDYVAQGLIDWTPWLVVIYAFIKISLTRVLKHIFTVGLLLVTTHCITWMMAGYAPVAAHYLMLLFLLAGLVSVFVFEWKQKKENNRVQQPT